MQKEKFLLHIRCNQIYTESIKNSYKLLEDDFIINLQQVGELTFKDVLVKQVVHGKHVVFTHAIEFFNFTVDGVIHIFSLFFTDESKNDYIELKQKINELVLNGVSYEK